MPDSGFSGPWWRFAPLRGALLAGLLAGAAFMLELFGLVPRPVAIAAYAAAIPLGGWHWIREGLEELVEEREVGIEILMIAATAGAASLGLWDEAAALVVLYGAAEGLEEYTFARADSAFNRCYGGEPGARLPGETEMRRTPVHRTAARSGSKRHALVSWL